MKLGSVPEATYFNCYLKIDQGKNGRAGDFLNNPDKGLVSPFRVVSTPAEVCFERGTARVRLRQPDSFSQKNFGFRFILSLWDLICDANKVVLANGTGFATFFLRCVLG